MITPRLIYKVSPSLPRELRDLETLAYNIWFCWTPGAVTLFHRLDRYLWEQTNHNPVELLGKVSQDRLKELAGDDSFLSQLNDVMLDLERYLNEIRPYEFNLVEPIHFNTAYFSAEFGLIESLPLYSGGLGVLAGDVLKSASDLAIPLIGVGLCYQHGYFRQYLNNDGWQQETYQENDFANMPLTLIKDGDDKPVCVTVKVDSREVIIKCWKIQVGRVPLFLLDTNNAENHPQDRDITAQLYGGNMEMRLKQELILGIGGVRMLDKLNIDVKVFHMNEGHSAFTTIERIRALMADKGLKYEEALEAITAGNVFTTHTPVPAGFDTFHPALIEQYFKDVVRELRITMNDFLAMGRFNPGDNNEPFSMAVLALKTSAYVNGVSILHRDISREIFMTLYPEVPESDVPIIGITNGVHIPSWTSIELQELFNRYLGPHWQEDPDNLKIWDRINQIPDSELWRTHERRRERLVAFCRRRLEIQLRNRGASPKEIATAREVLNPEALTIGFARRFATYKRATLLLKDTDRLIDILTNQSMPVQFIIAGKAHPQDNQGKELIRQLIHFMKDEQLRYRMVFLEDYDINVARYIVQGADVWLNTPRRPMEACGTSGMKSTANGAINLSVLDGWWDEGYSNEYGWAIGHGEDYTDHEYQDEVESKALYNLLEQEIIPLFYNRGFDNMPKLWIKKMKMSMSNLCPKFNSHRMIEDYMDEFYYKSAKVSDDLSRNNYEEAKNLAAWKKRIKQKWADIKIVKVNPEEPPPLKVGDIFNMDVDLRLGDILPDEVKVHIYSGSIDLRGKYVNRELIELSYSEDLGSGRHRFSGEITCESAGRFGFNIRILPYHPFLMEPLQLNLIIWG